MTNLELLIGWFTYYLADYLTDIVFACQYTQILDYLRHKTHDGHAQMTVAQEVIFLGDHQPALDTHALWISILAMGRRMPCLAAQLH